MAKIDKDNQLSPEATEALEIIELSIDDLDLLARAFQLIEEACDGDEPQASLTAEPVSNVIH